MLAPMARRLLAFFLLAVVAFPHHAVAAEEPPLPPGLGSSNGDSSETGNGEPALPPGLGGPSEGGAPAEPALPPGLREAGPGQGEDEPDASGREGGLPFGLRGFWEVRGGVRVVEDGAQSKAFNLGETRLQLEHSIVRDDFVLDVRFDAFPDFVTEELQTDLRELRLTLTPLPWMDLRIGRQVLTWGTGDLLFINDLFPKDFQSFLTGRDVEYLKAPGDAVKVGMFFDPVNIDVVYSPQFDPDRYITGERLSYWNPLFDERSGSSFRVNGDEPDEWFSNDEWAVRLYRTFGATEAALYFYDGYWKSPAGQDLLSYTATFPRLRVFGGSLRGTIGSAVANIEVGYYDSLDDRAGADPFVANSQLRGLIGYERELAKNFTGAVQFYVEHMLDYEAFEAARPFFLEPQDETRTVVTLRLTRLLLNQDLTLSLFTFWSPTDQDAYLRPKATYKWSDNVTLEAGMNVFAGQDDFTFYGQLEDNTNIYVSYRYSF